ncbi:MAG: hypothetical protein Q8878_00395 [Bacillota bacterium]|nr:hypothetical protein [Bacillota bacterium]
MPAEILSVCMEQKVILLTKILDLSKQIEVKCKQETVLLEDLPEKRMCLLKRIEKCDALVKNALSELPLNEKERLSLIMAAKTDGFELSGGEKLLAGLAKRSISLSSEIVRLNNNSIRTLSRARESLLKSGNLRNKFNPAKAY